MTTNTESSSLQPYFESLGRDTRYDLQTCLGGETVVASMYTVQYESEPSGPGDEDNKKILKERIDKNRGQALPVFTDKMRRKIAAIRFVMKVLKKMTESAPTEEDGAGFRRTMRALQTEIHYTTYDAEKYKESLMEDIARDVSNVLSYE